MLGGGRLKSRHFTRHSSVEATQRALMMSRNLTMISQLRMSLLASLDRVSVSRVASDCSAIFVCLFTHCDQICYYGADFE